MHDVVGLVREAPGGVGLHHLRGRHHVGVQVASPGGCVGAWTGEGVAHGEGVQARARAIGLLWPGRQRLGVQGVWRAVVFQRAPPGGLHVVLPSPVSREASDAARGDLPRQAELGLHEEKGKIKRKEKDFIGKVGLI